MSWDRAGGCPGPGKNQMSRAGREQDGLTATEGFMSVCNYIFPTSSVVLVTWGLCKTSLFFHCLLFLFYFNFFSCSDIEISSVTQSFDFL